ncbi:MAG: Patatin-like phospholipase [Idiomarinaceae bacterium HL-53]|nr:MAG: Patatin-like phospholipase [Idiomarinaceae bacterium HL-53]CUS49221.1 hypothetical protein Ga0003345_2209 [Idiomarinaceae bacterium HL-53]
MTEWIEIRAGEEAFQHIQAQGLQANDISLLLGASGGPKWFVLQGIDNFLFGEWFKGRTKPLNLLGTSAGGWRFASLGRADAAAASHLFCELYRATVYSAKPDVKEITEKAVELLEIYAPDTAVAEILEQTVFRHHMIVAQAKGLNASENRVKQGVGLMRAAASNAIHRKRLGKHFERVVFHHPAAHPPLGKAWQDLPTSHVQLTQENFRQALLATGSIPMVLAGVENILGTQGGMFRDGGVTDYHFDVDLSEQSGLVLYPHFQREVIPGWFDKKLKRRTTGKNWPRVINIVPTQAFIDALPYGKIPDRNDFAKFDPQTRQKYWQQAVDAGYRMTEQLEKWISSGEISQRVKAWS